MEQPVVLTLDPSNTTIRFQVRWFGFATVRGRFGACTGELRLPGSPALDGARIRVVVDAPSVATGIALRDAHLRGRRFLDAARFPQIVFESNRLDVRDGVLFVAGSLTLHGRTEPLVANCPLDAGADARRRRLCGVTTVSRRRFEIGSPDGFAKLNPLFPAIADRVDLQVEVTVPATMLSSPLTLVRVP